MEVEKRYNPLPDQYFRAWFDNSVWVILPKNGHLCSCCCAACQIWWTLFRLPKFQVIDLLLPERAESLQQKGEDQ
jgi:hypothetical protein